MEDLATEVPHCPSVLIFMERGRISFLFAHDEKNFATLPQKHKDLFYIDRPIRMVAWKPP